jgi:hypothetical protein
MLPCAGLMKFFADEFGFSPNETVALMGAHTLGSAIPHNSGFKARHHPPHNSTFMALVFLKSQTFDIHPSRNWSLKLVPYWAVVTTLIKKKIKFS